MVAFHHSTDLYAGDHKDIVYTVALANHFANVVGIGFAGDKHPATHQHQHFPDARQASSAEQTGGTATS